MWQRRKNAHSAFPRQRGCGHGIAAFALLLPRNARHGAGQSYFQWRAADVVDRRERVINTMVNRTQQLARNVRLRHAATLAAVLGLSVAGIAGSSLAQQAAPPAKKPPEKAPAAAPAKKPAAAAAPAAGAAQAAQSAWVKLCEKLTGVAKDKDGKEEKKEANVCLTHHERIDATTGQSMVSAAVRHLEGQDKQAFMVMIPLGAFLKPGLRAIVYPKDAWEKLQKNEQIDESKLKTFALEYTVCHPQGCTAETEATPELLNELKSNSGLIAVAFNVTGRPTGFPVSLAGFEQAYAGPPVDAKQYGEARRALAQQIAQRQQEMAEAYKKQQEAAKSGATTGATPPPAAAPAAGAAPAPKR